MAVPPSIRHAIDRTPESASFEVRVIDTGETNQPLSPAVASGTARETGAVPSTVNVPLLVNAVLAHASTTRSDQV